MENLIGRKFYLSEPYINFPYPEDIRILSENDEEVLIKDGARKIVIDKDTLHKYYTMITPKMTFAIRFLTNADLRNSIIISINSYKPKHVVYDGEVVYYQYIDLLNLYMGYKIDKKFYKHYYTSNISHYALDEEHAIRIQKKSNTKEAEYYRERRTIVYGYLGDTLRDLIKFIPRKKWLNIIKHAFNCVNSIYDYGIEISTKSLLRFFNEMRKDYTTSIETCNILDIVPDTCLKLSDGYTVIQVLVSLKLAGNKELGQFTDQEVEVLTTLLNFDHGVRPKSFHYNIANIDLGSIKVRSYKETDNIEEMKSNNPSTFFKLLKLTEPNELYIVSFDEKPIVKKVSEWKSQNALTKEEINKFLTKKTVN